MYKTAGHRLIACCSYSLGISNLLILTTAAICAAACTVALCARQANLNSSVSAALNSLVIILVLETIDLSL